MMARIPARLTRIHWTARVAISVAGISFMFYAAFRAGAWGWWLLASVVAGNAWGALNQGAPRLKSWEVPLSDLANLAQVAERISHELGITVSGAWEVVRSAENQIRRKSPGEIVLPWQVYTRAIALIGARGVFRDG